MLKTIDCGDLRASHDGQTVTLAGWVHHRRDHGGLIFIDLRDAQGLAQVVFNPSGAPEAHQIAEQFRAEWVVQVTGIVRRRPAGTENPLLPTGEVEVLASATQVLNPSKTPPFDVSQDGPVDELLRLEHRYLDLRRPHMRDNIRLRHRVVQHIHRFLDERGFLEIETPILTKSTPEGARDYLVPSRIHHGEFYALPQSPQQLKQLLMVSGFGKYFQIARCFRDEDSRVDRQPEFTQLDMEMSFVDVEDVLAVMEELYVSIVQAVAPHKRVPTPLPRIPYQEALARYGSDKPDIRFGLELADFTDLLGGTDFQVFQSVVASGGVVKGLAAPGMASLSRSETDAFIDLARSHGAAGLVTIALSGDANSLNALTADDLRTQARALSVEEVRAMAERAGAEPGDLLLIAAGPREKTEPVLGALRLEVGRRLELADPNVLAFCFVVDFPLLEWDADADRWTAMHHPFTSPRDEDWEGLERNPGAVVARAYDLACNGSEMAGGSIRIYQPDKQERMFALLGYTSEQVRAEFGHLLEAFSYGAPPHGGFAGGIDRLVAMLSDTAESIRDTIAFPKTQAAVDPLFGAPSPVADQQLAELHIRVVSDDGP